LRFPYRVSNVSEALGVCLIDMDRVDETAADCGAPTIATTNETASR
jgi:hypothetical protein